MNFAEQPPSKQWASLKFRGQAVAEVWFKPESEPLALTLRIPLNSFQIPGINQRLTAENLLKAVGIATQDVESWRYEGADDFAINEASPEPGHPLPPPREDRSHLTLHFHLRPSQAPAAARSDDAQVPESKWQDLEARWKAILGVEATIETLRMSMEALRAEMEASSRRTLTTDEKVHVVNSYVLQWNKAKSRLVHAVPKAKEFIHRATWATGTPERKKLEELFENHIRPRIPFPDMNQIVEQLEGLLKDRQVLAAHGVSVQQECAAISRTVQEALRALQSNAATNATRKRGAGAKGKSL